ncbi:uncharacterized protein LOC111062821 [Nilaparvata lugens]|uniref:uncharacterized protein LOC111062821 n=1 Tax=Nilaparvata lugens TaxID=108931 RepID=UPI000B987051|nr:uncharacterized protein LOC111062821 [Nilaparvata lugens]
MYSLSAISFVVAAAMLCMLNSGVRAEETGLEIETPVHHRQERSLLNGLLCDVSRLCLNLDVKANVNLCCKCNSKGTYIKLKNECHRKVASCLLSSLSSTLSGLTSDLPVVDAKLCANL